MKPEQEGGKEGRRTGRKEGVAIGWRNSDAMTHLCEFIKPSEQMKNMLLQKC